MRLSLHLWKVELLLQLRRRDSVPSVIVVPPELQEIVADVVRGL